MKSRLPVEVCDVSYAQSLIGGKWKVVILWKMLDASMRLSQLRRALPGISEVVLISQLRELERDGLVLRTDFGTLPPHVEYALTPTAQGLRPLLEQIETWGALQRKRSDIAKR